MLPNHVPLVVAEQFGMLEAIYPAGSILASAPGTDRVTARALRRNIEPLSDEDFPEQLAEHASILRATKWTGNRAGKSEPSPQKAICQRSGCSGRAATAPN